MGQAGSTGGGRWRRVRPALLIIIALAFVVAGAPIFFARAAGSDIVGTLTYADLNGGTTLPGDSLEYTLAVANQGGVDAGAVTVTDVLPAGLDYIPMSLASSDGTGYTSLTDAAGDDRADYVAGSRTITFRIGAGATATQGGTLAPGMIWSVRFRARIDDAATGTIADQAVVAYEAGGTAFMTPSNAAPVTIGGVPTATPPATATMTATPTAIPANTPTTATGTATTIPTSTPAATGTPLPTATATPRPLTVTASVVGLGALTPSGVTSYTAGGLATYTATPASGQVFLGWNLDGQPKGYAPTITLTVDKAYTLEAIFGPRQVFADAGPDKTGATEAIAQLAARGVIKGCDQAANRFCPTDPTLRAQMAVLIVRALGWGGAPSSNPFTDRNGVDDELWNAVGILAAKGVVNGYGDGTFGTTSPVLNAQVISFITRAMVEQGRWQFQPDNGTVYPNVPASSGHRQDLVTYAFYAGAVRGTSTTTANFDGWDATSSRAYFAFVLWQALGSYYGVDAPGLGGYIP